MKLSPISFTSEKNYNEQKPSTIGIVVDKSKAKRDWFQERKIAIIGADESQWMMIRTHNLTPDQKKIPMFNTHCFPDNSRFNVALVNRTVWENANQAIKAEKFSFTAIMEKLFSSLDNS